MNKKCLKLFGLSLVLFLVFSCKMSNNVGLGTAIDLEPPVLTMTYPNVTPGVTTYVPPSFTIRGTCTDNVKVEKVTVTYRYTSNGKEFEQEVLATIEENNWSAPIEVNDDVDLEVIIVATDKLKNVSEESVKSLMACVDTENPYAKDFGVKKNGQLTTLKPLVALQQLDEKQSASKDDLQNEEFSIVATLTDNNIIKGATLSLYDAVTGEEIFTGREIDEGIPNPYKPVWTIKESDLIAVNTKYNTGRHYFTPKFTVTDAAENTTYDIYSDSLCWYPESDAPKTLFPLASEGVITVGTGVEIPISIFDDDGINKIYYQLIPSANFVDDAKTTFEATDKSEFILASELGEGTRDHNLTLKTGDEAGQYYIVVAVEDKKQIDGYTNIWEYHSVTTNVVNENAPIVIISTPQENTSAELNASNQFTIKGFSLDDQSVITDNEKANNSILIAWLPDGTTSQVNTARAMLKDIATGESKTVGLVKTDAETGIKIWKPATSADSTEEPKFAGYVKDTFEQTFTVAGDGADFKVGGQLKNESKLFLIYVIDKTGNVSTKTFRLGAYKIPPKIKVEYLSGGTYYPFDAAMMTYTDGSEITFKITPEHPNGLGINYDSFTATNNNTPVTAIKDGGSYTFTVTVASGDRIELAFGVKDVLGNQGSQKKTVVVSEKANLESITTDTMEGTTLKKGDVLTIQANFTSNVELTGVTETNRPYIVLSNIKNASGVDLSDQRALYTKGSGTDTLYFEYTILGETKTSDPYNYVETPAGSSTESPITLNGANINGNINIATINRLSAYEIKIDAVPPHYVSGSYAKGASTDDTITLTFDEDIFKESGTITLQRTANWAIPPVLDEEIFKAIYASLDSKDKIALIGSDTGEPALIGSDTETIDDDAATPIGPYKKITHGLILSDDETKPAVPDTSTKYVLAFDLDIYDTTGTVAKIRKILEVYGYHKKEFDISECTISGKNLSFKVPKSWFVDGREFEVIIDEGCVRDSVGNVNAAVTRDTTNRLKFWTDKVAKPVIRVDRYTHGAGVREPNAGGTFDAAYATVLTRATAFSTAPTGYARVRIDCETPNATITYGTDNVTAALVVDGSTPAKISKGNGKTENRPCEDATVKKVTDIDETAKTYSTFFAVGSESLEESGKWYIKARATHASATGTQPAMTASDVAYEGAYKTVIYSHNPDKTGISATQPIVAQGSDSAGEPLIAGFPMRDASPDLRYERVMYKYKSEGKGDYVVVSYDIVSTFRMQTFVTNWSKEGDSNCAYGWIIYNDGRTFH